MSSTRWMHVDAKLFPHFMSSLIAQIRAYFIFFVPSFSGELRSSGRGPISLIGNNFGSGSSHLAVRRSGDRTEWHLCLNKLCHFLWPPLHWWGQSVQNARELVTDFQAIEFDCRRWLLFYSLNSYFMNKMFFLKSLKIMGNLSTVHYPLTRGGVAVLLGGRMS